MGAPYIENVKFHIEKFEQFSFPFFSTYLHFLQKMIIGLGSYEVKL